MSEPITRIQRYVAAPVIIESIELLRADAQWFVRSRSRDAAEGLAIVTGRAADFHPILNRRVIPWFRGRDARDLEHHVDEIARHQSNYKLGFAFWNCVGWVEFSLLDLLGQVCGRSVGQLLGEPRRRDVAVYLSSMRRDTSPEAEVEWVTRRLAETGARAVKLKIGGRMSGNTDAAPGRTPRLVELARRSFGERVTIYVDANGSYDAANAIEVGRMLEEHQCGFFEEPCPFDEYEQTRAVARVLRIPVAAGEQESSAARFRWMIERRGVDIVQPDVNYHGGFIRTLRIARLAGAAGLPITPHCPKRDPNLGYMLHLVSVLDRVGPFHEFAAAGRPGNWFEPSVEPVDGKVTVPDSPGLGYRYDPDLLRQAVAV